MFMTGRARTTKSVSAATLMTTRNALTVADSRVRSEAHTSDRQDALPIYGAEWKAAEQDVRHVALLVLGLFGRGRNRVEAHRSEEDRCRGGADSAEAERREGFEILHVHDGKGEDDEKRQRRDLDDDEKRIDRRRFARADDKEHGNEPGDEHRRQVDHAAVIWPEHQSRRYVYGEGIFDEAHDIARPADRHGRSEEHTS